MPADFPPLKTLDPHHAPLPVLLTPLIGREQEVAGVYAELAHPTVCLLTLLGTGGIGKTRLSPQMRGHFADGVCFVTIAPIRDSELVVSAIAQVHDIRERGARPLLEQLRQALRHRQQLLLLDNVEQVVTVAPHIEFPLIDARRVVQVPFSEAGTARSNENRSGAHKPARLPGVA